MIFRPRASTCALVLLAHAGIAAAQTPVAATAPRWEIELHGGMMPVSTSNITDPATQDVPRSPMFNTISGLPSYRVSSWFLGDGSSMVDTVGTALGTDRRMVRPPILRPLAHLSAGAAIGARLTRRFARHEFDLSFDYAWSGIEMEAGALDAFRVAAESFAPAWREIIGKLPSSEALVDSGMAFTGGSTRDLITAGAFQLHVRQAGTWRPFVTFGAALISTPGDRPEIVLTGQYSYRLESVTRIDETDVVTVRVSADRHAFAFIVGGGVKRESSRGIGFRADVRAHISKNPFSTTVDAAPERVTALPGESVVTYNTITAPSLQVSNSTNADLSSFGHPFGGEQRTFKGGGAIARVTFTAGVFWRF